MFELAIQTSRSLRAERTAEGRSGGAPFFRRKPHYRRTGKPYYRRTGKPYYRRTGKPYYCFAFE